jgi:hypothetical protein
MLAATGDALREELSSHPEHKWLRPTQSMLSSVPDASQTECERISHLDAKTFMHKYVAQSRPVIITHDPGIRQWSALEKWDKAYLASRAANGTVRVFSSQDGVFEGIGKAKYWSNPDGRGGHSGYAVDGAPSSSSFSASSASSSSSSGKRKGKNKKRHAKKKESEGGNGGGPADSTNNAVASVTGGSDGEADDLETLMMVRPAENYMTFQNYLDLIDPSYANKERGTFYLQKHDVEQWASEETGHLSKDLDPPLADQGFPRFLKQRHHMIWMGSGDTTGALHHDDMENVFVMVRGAKQFDIFHPSYGKALGDGTPMRTGHLLYDWDGSKDEARGGSKFYHLPLDATQKTAGAFSPIMLSRPDRTRFPDFHKARRLRCVIKEGEALYLPSFWWHEVTSFGGDGLNIGINHFYEPWYVKGSDRTHFSRNPYYQRMFAENPEAAGGFDMSGARPTNRLGRGGSSGRGGGGRGGGGDGGGGADEWEDDVLSLANLTSAFRFRPLVQEQWRHALGILA